MWSARVAGLGWAVVAVAVWAGLGCQAGGAEPLPGGGETAGTDTDGDGICDATEADYGSDPESLDSDEDGLPDGLEVVLGYDPGDPNSPSREQLGPILQSGDDPLSLRIGLTADGDGGNYQGAFIPLSSPFIGLPDATDLYQGAMAATAVPPDNVRLLEAKEERFVSVSGLTQLNFDLLFVLSQSDESPCATALPFGYGLYDDSGREIDQRYRVLRVGPFSDPPRAEDYCAPGNCF